uniref:Bis(5'-nucleosyl)-tetraphosphatase [asymmetrical] n=1 Tax=Phallusia mammillata TaxID=59560 RepID=A0A6F9DNL5_9ASCI|nr:diphosphoinositol polyphosphate phosphohydrolase 1-like [Phallusia mammillata]
MGLVKAAGLILFRRPCTSSIVEFLLLQASYGEHHWSPPKGHVDPGEDDLTTALRETHEESGFDKESFTVLKDFKIQLNYQVKNKPKLVTYWLAELKDPKNKVTLSDEHQDFVWLPIAEAMQRSGYDDMQDALKKAHEYITRQS